jgi:hypothetical protein
MRTVAAPAGRMSMASRGTTAKVWPVDDARQRLIDEVDRIRARKEHKGE